MRYNHEGVISKIDELPGCGQIAVFNYVFLAEELRGKGRGKIAHHKRLLMARALGFDYALCTVVDNNEKEKHILESFHWTRLDSFVSTKTNNTVTIWGRLVDDKRKPILSAEDQSYVMWEESLKGIKR